MISSSMLCVREELLRGIGIYITNAANMAPRTGRWLLPTFSFLSHSCVSNSRFFISPGGVARSGDNEGSHIYIIILIM